MSNVVKQKFFMNTVLWLCLLQVSDGYCAGRTFRKSISISSVAKGTNAQND